MTYVLPNRKAFSDSITRIFLRKNYRELPPDQQDKDEDLCLRQGNKNTRELFSYQKLVRDYLLMETPYRGLLLYHGLGSGKTCSSIAVAESLLSSKKVFVILPASLQSNYRGEIRKCGDPIYAVEQHWEQKLIKTPEDKVAGKALGLSDEFLDANMRFFVNKSGMNPNFTTQSTQSQKVIRAQIDDLLNHRFTFINYDGISSVNVDKILPPDQPHMFDDSVVIIDEAHNLIGSVVNDRAIKRKLYDMLYNARDCKIVALSGTPIINRPNEIAFLLNLLKGPIERITVPMKATLTWDEGALAKFFRSIPDVDTVEFNSVKRAVMLTRNPPHFESVYTEKEERNAVKYKKELEFEADITKWVGTWKNKFETTFGGNEIADPEKFVVEKLECLPSKYEEFMELFVDGLTVKNPMMFQRRIQGLVSYYKGADERVLPKRIDEENFVVKIPFSDEQFTRYLEARFIEIQRESKKGRKPDLNEDFGSFRMTSRLACNYAVPPEMKQKTDDDTNENSNMEKPEILEALKKQPEKFLSDEGLKIYSPKMLQMLTDLKKNIGGGKNQFIYSQYLSLEGLGVFAAILDYNGFQPYKIRKNGAGEWEEDPDMDADKPAYAMFVGGNEEERELYRQIFNESYSDTFPQRLKDSIKKHRLCVFMASKAGAEGITLANVRNVYIMEPYWNPARMDQVIGRAIRICSHASLPKDERTVDVKLYMSVFTKEQATSPEGANIVAIRRNDMVLKRYEGETPLETFMTSDEFLYEVAFEKSRIIKQISHLLKQSAVDCEIHRPLHSKEKPVIQCMRFDTNITPDELGYKPAVLAMERDTQYTKNVIRKTRSLQRVMVKGVYMIIDPDSNDVFDAIAFDDSKRLLPIGKMIPPNQIRFFTSVVS
jgi:Helicase conserved C-terminal domain/Type III restriction enzyme, res subunit